MTDTTVSNIILDNSNKQQDLLSNSKTNDLPSYYKIFDYKSDKSNNYVNTFSLFPQSGVNNYINSYSKTLMNDNLPDKENHQSLPSNYHLSPLKPTTSISYNLCKSDMPNNDSNNIGSKKEKRNKNRSIMQSNYNLRSKKIDDTKSSQIQKTEQKNNSTATKPNIKQIKKFKNTSNSPISPPHPPFPNITSPLSKNQICYSYSPLALTLPLPLLSPPKNKKELKKSPSVIKNTQMPNITIKPITCPSITTLNNPSPQSKINKQNQPQKNKCSNNHKQILNNTTPIPISPPFLIKPSTTLNKSNQPTPLKIEINKPIINQYNSNLNKYELNKSSHQHHQLLILNNPPNPSSSLNISTPNYTNNSIFNFNINKLPIINTNNDTVNHILHQQEEFKLYTPPPTPKLKSIIETIIKDEVSPIKLINKINIGKNTFASHKEQKTHSVINQTTLIKDPNLKHNKPNKKNLTLHNTFLNLTDKEIPSELEEYLSRGYNQTINRSTNKNKYKELTDLEFFVRMIINKETGLNASLDNLNHKQRGDIHNLQIKSMSKIKTLKHNKSDFSIIKKIREYLRDNNLTITLADKSKTLVLMEANIYNQLMLQAIKENNFTKLKTNTNITKERKMQNLVRTLGQEEKTPLSKSQYNYIYPSGCPCPNIFGKIKIHKNPIALRPIVNASSAYFTRMSKWLINNILLKYVYKTHAVKNSYEFKKKLLNIKIEPNDYMFSLDATSMYSYLPREDIIKYFMHRYKYDQNKSISIKLPLLWDILHQCTSDICVEYNGEYYTQAGLAMGSAISPVFGEVALYLIENRLLKNKQLKIKLLVHYADDIFVLASKKESAMDTLTYINEISKDLKFTLETENLGILNYLDITVIRQDHFIDFKVYRKPDSNNLRIDYESQYQMHTKLNVLNQEIIRAYKLCSTNLYLKQELDLIRYTYLANNYPIELINNKIAYIDKVAIKGFTKINRKDETLKYHSIIIQNQEFKIFLNNQLHKLKKSGNWKCISELCLAQASPNTVYQCIRHQGKSGVAAIHTQNIVYQSKCLKCHATYVGCTERNYSLRFKEHMSNDSSALKTHSNLGDDHNFDLSDSSFKILAQEENNLRRFIMESYIIFHEKPALNLSAGITLINKPI